MMVGTITVGGRTISIKGSRDSINSIACHLREPYNLTSRMASECTTPGIVSEKIHLFGEAWSWSLFPDLKAAYDEELAKYTAALLDEYTARSTLPDRSWIKKYIPTEAEVARRREAAKSPEQRERERIEAERQEQQNARDRAEREAAQAEANAKWTALYPHAEPVTVPVGSMAVYLEHVYDDSDPMTDYYHPHCQHGADLLLGIVREGPQTEATARRILSRHPALYADPAAWTWHTENYSMGHGNYLTGPLSPLTIPLQTYGTRTPSPVTLQYEVRFAKTYGKPSTMQPYPGYPGNGTPDNSPNDGDAPGTVNGITITRNLSMGGIEIRFPAKPTDAHIEAMRRLGFRYSFKQHINYARYSPALWELIHETLGVPLPTAQDAPTEHVQEDALATAA